MSDTPKRNEAVALPVYVATAPERIYLQIADDEYYAHDPFPSDEAEVTWCSDSVMALEVPYVRADLHQSALDALRGEVERRKSAQAALSQYASAAEQRADAAERRLAEVREIQRSNYGNGVGLHLEMILWAREYDALTKESP